MAKLGMMVIASLVAMAVTASCGAANDPAPEAVPAAAAPAAAASAAPAETGYADVNGLRMYYEIHGQGEPVILLHGAYMNAEQMRPIAAVLAKKRRVIIPEAQAHARTADIDRPLTYEAMADDVAALMDHIKIPKADIVGYSMGAGTALQVAIRHPEKVDRLVAASGTYKTEGMYPEVVAMFPTMTLEMFAGSPFEAEYKKLAADPNGFPVLFEKLKQLDTTPQNWPASDIQKIAAPTLVVVGDADVVTPEHALEMFRLLGGGKPGDMGTPVPDDQLAIIPGTTHIGVFALRAALLGQMAADFIDPPPPFDPFAAPPPAPQQ